VARAARRAVSGWSADCLDGFEAKRLAFPDDYDGPVTSTLVRLPQREAPRGAVLYVHGFIDYFFQRHAAVRFAEEGFAFHALDLRKHGRSLGPHQHPCFCRSISEYFDDLTRALAEIDEPVLLAGHSTGGLICALYAHAGERREQVRALWLNSPFFEFNARGLQQAKLALGIALGRRFPFLSDRRSVPPAYVKSLHREFGGEWEFDLAWKPVDGFPIYFGWLSAIRDAHAKVHAGLGLDLPVLSMHSDEADIILDWRQIARWSRTLSARVSVLQFPGALHDLVLSRVEIREEVFRQLFDWAGSLDAI
jgi:alpha-beta hydrolase superfamily lysophospholipase